MRHSFFISFVFICILYTSYCQSSISDSAIGISLVSFDYSYQVPFEDMKDRFGTNSAIGIGYAFKFKSNWEVGLSYSYLFGKNVKDTKMLDELKTNEGILNENGEFAAFNLYERGHHVQLKGGKTFAFLSPNPNSGFYFQAGTGFIIHKVKIQNGNSDIPQFNVNNREYMAGYDRYTSGITFCEEIGYRYLSNNSLINFHVGLEFIQGYTRLRRDYQVDYPATFENTTRKDFLLGVKAGWILPIYKRPSKDFYY